MSNIAGRRKKGGRETVDEDDEAPAARSRPRVGPHTHEPVPTYHASSRDVTPGYIRAAPREGAGKKGLDRPGEKRSDPNRSNAGSTAHTPPP